MKVKNVKLEWYVLCYDFNNKKIRFYNVLNENIKNELAKKIRSKKIITFFDLKNFLEIEFKYYYWSRTEWEISVGKAFETNANNLEKIDIYYQLEPNLNRIAEYINNKMELNLI